MGDRGDHCTPSRRLGTEGRRFSALGVQTPWRRILLLGQQPWILNVAQHVPDDPLPRPPMPDRLALPGHDDASADRVRLDASDAL